VTELVLLAVTRMQSGVCIGGTPRLTTGVAPRWVRPVKPFGALMPNDIRLPHGGLMQCWDIVALSLGRARSHPPHVEDVEADFVHQRPELRGRVAEADRRTILERMIDPEPEQLWREKQRSLTVFQPSALAATFSLDPYSGRYEARLWWPRCGRADGLPVTDLKWRALGRRLTAGGPAEQRLDAEELRGLLGCDDFFVAAGLSRAFHGDYWPLVVAIHTFPDYHATIDENCL
jgi:hypothetical protein